MENKISVTDKDFLTEFNAFLKTEEATTILGSLRARLEKAQYPGKMN